MKNNPIEKPKLKKKHQDNFNLCNEFKGLSSLSKNIEIGKIISKIEQGKSEPTSSITENDESNQKNNKSKNKNKSKTIEITKSVAESIQPATNSILTNPEKRKKKTLSDSQNTNEPVNKKQKADEKYACKTYTLIENIDSSLTSNDLKNHLLENGISFDKVLVMSGSVAVANFERQKEMEKLFNLCQGVLYKNNELFIFKTLNENKQEQKLEEKKCVSNLCENSIHLKNLDLTVSEEDLIGVLGDLPIKSISLNSEKKTAVIEFNDNQSARICVDLLDQKLIGDKTVQASFLVKSQRPDVFTLKLSNLPKDISKHQLQIAFPTATKIKFQRKLAEQCLIHFKNDEDYKAVLNSESEFVINEQKVTVEEYVSNKTKKQPELKTQYVLNIFNLPFDTTVNELRGHYLGVRYVEMLKNDEGNFMGSAKLMYDDKACCEEALKSSKGKTFKHRRVRAEMKIVENFNKYHESSKRNENVDE